MEEIENKKASESSELVEKQLEKKLKSESSLRGTPDKQRESSDDEDSYASEAPEENEENLKMEWKDGETLFQVRVLYGLGRCADLIWPQGMMLESYRSASDACL